MQCMKVELTPEGAYLETYFLGASPEIRDSRKHPAILICPGGAYAQCSDREAEPIALAFCARGFSCAVLRYPCAPARFPTQLCAAARAMAWMKEHAEQYHLDSERIAVAGFSAGGHLAASLGVFWNREFLAEKTGLPAEAMRPWKLVLSYPVITSGEYISEYTFRCLLGEEGFADSELKAFVSLENQVTDAVPPAFLWHTVTDPCVPAENSMVFAMALKKAGVPFEMHLYSRGNHGLALSNRLTLNAEGDGAEPCCEGWVELAADWLMRE